MFLFLKFLLLMLGWFWIFGKIIWRIFIVKSLNGSVKIKNGFLMMWILLFWVWVILWMLLLKWSKRVIIFLYICGLIWVGLIWILVNIVSVILKWRRCWFGLGWKWLVLKLKLNWKNKRVCLRILIVIWSVLLLIKSVMSGKYNVLKRLLLKLKRILKIILKCRRKW